MVNTMTTQTISNSANKELDRLITVMTSCAKRPAMYGYPEYVELACKHLAHISLSIIFPNWDFEATEKFWISIVNAFEQTESFTPRIYEQMSYRQEKWGEQESEARLQVLVSFQNIWQWLQTCHRFAYTSEWIEFLFNSPSLLGSPNSLDTTFHLLIGIALIDDHCYKLFNEKYEAICTEIKGSGSRGLQDIGVKEGWLDKPQQYIYQTASYTHLSEGITELIRRLNALRTDENQRT